MMTYTAIPVTWHVHGIVTTIRPPKGVPTIADAEIGSIKENTKRDIKKVRIYTIIHGMKDSWKPRKKTITIIGALFVFSILFVWFSQDRSFLPLLSKKDLTTATAEDLSTKDSDGDGIRDWEEFLWNLDPNKKDTDGNGIPDDKELETKRAALQALNTSSTSTASSTFTDTFSKEFFVAFNALKQSGNLTEANMTKLSQQSLSALTQTTLEPKYSKTNLIIASSTPNTKTAYQTAITQTGKGLTVTSLGKELNLLYKAINKPKSEKLIVELTKIQEIYLTLAERTIAIPVPSAIQNSHLDLANNYYKLGAAVGGMTKIYTDPALSIVYFSEYQKALDSLLLTMSTIQKYTQ